MVDSKAGNLGHLVMPESKEVQKKKERDDGVLSKGYRGHFEGAPTGQIWDDLNIKIIKVCSEL